MYPYGNSGRQMVNGQLQRSASSEYRNGNVMYLMIKVLMAAVHWLRRLCDDRRTNGHRHLLKHPPTPTHTHTHCERAPAGSSANRPIW